MYLDLAGPLIDLEERDERGCTALLVALEAHSFILKKATLLLDRGADITARDFKRRGCLHYWFSVPRSSWFEHRRGHGAMDMARLLLNRGADVNAVDSYGCSVTEAAYQSGLAAAWEAALIHGGFDVKEMFAQLYQDFPAARCSCGRPRAQKMTQDSYSRIRWRYEEYCAHVKECEETGKEYDGHLGTEGHENPGKGSLGLLKGVHCESDEDWDTADDSYSSSDDTQLEGTASPILEGSW